MKTYILLFLFLGAFSVNSLAQSNADIVNVQSKFMQQEALLKAQYEKQKYHMEISGLKLIEHYSAKAQSNIDDTNEDECFLNYKQYWLDLDYLISSFDTNEDKVQAIALQKFLTLRTAIQTLAKINLRHLKPCSELYNTLSSESQTIDDMLKAQWVDNVKALDNSYKNFSATASSIKSLIDLQIRLNDYKGEANFSYNSNQVYNDGSSDDDQFSFNIGLQLDKSIYPGEFNFDANLGLIVNGTQFEESITNINFSYDHDISSAANPLRREVFGFVSRSSNSFLDVEQRYEIGGGLIFNWFSKTITSSGVKIDEKYKLLKEIDMVGDELKSCSESVCELYPNLTSISNKEIDVIKELYEKTQNMNRKRFAKWRGGLLVSFNIEFEEFTAPDSIQVARIDNSEEIKTISTPFQFSHTSIPRLELRPFIEGNFNDKFIFKIKPYIFLPAKLWETEKSFTNYNGEEIKKYDIRYFVQSSITVRAHPVSVSISLNYQHDSLPRNNITLDETGQYGTFYETKQTHLFTRIGFGYSFE